MGKIDLGKAHTGTLRRRHIKQMLRYVDEYELVKEKKHLEFTTATNFYVGRNICKQNFLKYYRHYLACYRNEEALLPQKIGRKFKDLYEYDQTLVTHIQKIRTKGYNRFDIAELLYKRTGLKVSPSTIYRITKKLVISALTRQHTLEKRKIIKMFAGEMGHIDVHYVAKDAIRELPGKRAFIVGLIDDYSCICCLEVITSITALEVMFATQELLFRMKGLYGISFKEMLSDNGSEFRGGEQSLHPFERMLQVYNITHRYTRPVRPQTNGKIERFWKTLEDEVLDGEEFKTMGELKEYVRAYEIYYNEKRPYQGINNKTPIQILV